MLLLAPLLGLLPHATLAAIVIVYSVGLIQPGEFLAIRKVRTMEFRWAIVAALGVLMFGTLKGIIVAIILSLIGLFSQTDHPCVSVIGRKRGADVLRPLSPEHPDDETCGRRDASSSSTRSMWPSSSTRWSRSTSQPCWRWT
jgi:sulfate permease, SulP family